MEIIKSIKRNGALGIAFSIWCFIWGHDYYLSSSCIQCGKLKLSHN